MCASLLSTTEQQVTGVAETVFRFAKPLDDSYSEATKYHSKTVIALKLTTWT